MKSITREVIANIIPAIVVEIMLLIYNLADTFFIAQTGDPFQIAAVSLAGPVFLVLISVGIAFMIGAMSFISRTLGAGNNERADNIASFCVWASFGTGIILAVIFMMFLKKFLILIGASPDTFDFAYNYSSIVLIAVPFALFSMTSGGIMRAENNASGAMKGQIFGNMLNVILDPVMILYFNLGITGAAIATTISIIAGSVYYAGYFLTGKSSLSVNIKNFRLNNGIALGVLAIGIPASLDPLLMSVSQMFVNSMMSAYGDMALAAAGVAMKINQIAGLIAMGSGQGVQPLLGFCVGAETWEKYRSMLKFALKFTVSVSLVLVALCFIFTPQIVSTFLDEPQAFNYSVDFTRILLTTAIAFGIFFIFVNALQAMGAARASLILSICRQCVFYVPSMFVLNYFFGAYGLIWALPSAEIISLVQTYLIYGRIIFNPNLYSE
ncbi:MAG: MATE family efflux transporter [Synergistaceae bacterium]|nr:MATE family efflux transporter [Synergistaceae bacterium]